jgi:hypothetical protein
MVGLARSARGAVVALVLLAVPACGEPREEPTTLPPITESPTPSPSPSSSPSPTARRTPGQFDEATQREAEQFVRQWWDTVNSALVGGSPEPLRSLYVQRCAKCEDMYRRVKTMRDAGRTASSPGYKVIRTAYDTNIGAVALVNAVVQPQPGRLLASDGTVVREVSGGPPIDYVFNVVMTKDAWLVQDLLNFGFRSS